MNSAMNWIVTTILGMVVTLSGCKSNDDSDHDHAAKHGHSAKHDHPGHGAPSDHAGATSTTAPAAQNYADAIHEFRTHMASLAAILKSGDYDGVHKDSVAIGKLGESIGTLAAAQGSPVPSDNLKDVKAAGTELAAAARSFHKAAHNDDLPRVKADYAQMGKLIDSLARHVPRP